MDNYILKLTTALICLVPFSLIIGPAVADLNICIVGIFFIYLSFIKKDYSFYTHPLIIFLLIFYFYILFASFSSSNILLSLESSLFYFRFIFFAMSVWFCIKYEKHIIKYFYFSLIFSITLIIIDSYFQYFIGYNITGNEYSGERLSSFFGDELILGSYVSRLMPLLFAMTIINYPKSKFIICLTIVIFVLSDIIILLSGERTALFYLIFSSLVIIILIENWKMLRFIAIIFSIIISLFIIYLDTSVNERIVGKTINQISNPIETPNHIETPSHTSLDDDKTKLLNESLPFFLNKINIFSIQHEVIYRTALKIFLDYPIKGIGPKIFREMCKDSRYATFTKKDRSINGCQTHPHNTYIQLLTETGVIGFILFLCLFLILCGILIKHFFMKIIKKKILHTDYQICLLTCLLISMWPFVPTGNIFNNWLNIIYFLPLGFVLASFQNKKQ